MSFLSPALLWLLLLVPLFVALYIALLARKKNTAVRYASVSLVREALDRRHSLRRHLPAALFLVAIVTSILAIARPTATITLPSDQRTVVLAIDVSLSMERRGRRAGAQPAADGPRGESSEADDALGDGRTRGYRLDGTREAYRFFCA